MAQYSKGQQTRDEIVVAMGELSAQLGHDNVTTRMVAEKAGVNIGSIHYHFGSKDGLLEAMLRMVTKDWMERPLRDALEGLWDGMDTQGGQRKAVRAVVRNQIDHLRKIQTVDRWQVRVLFQIFQQDGSLSDILRRDYIDPMVSMIQDVFRRIKPAVSNYELMHYLTLVTSPLCFHSDHVHFVLRELDEPAYSNVYLAGLEDCLVTGIFAVVGLLEDETIGNEEL